LVYNGEVYNYVELKAGLESKGVRFRTESDTEVLLHALSRQGANAVQDFNGMFAYAFWDSQEQKLVIARDRLGIKPLYYFEDSEGIVYASEIKSIIALKRKIFKPDSTLIDAYMSMGYVPGEKTWCSGI